MDQATNVECCPRFDPAPWDGKMHEWESKKFVKAKVWTFLHIPLNFGSVITKLMTRIGKAGGQAQDWMALSDHTSAWNMDLYVAVDKEIPGVENTTLSGKFFSQAYEGDFKDTGKWMQDFMRKTKEQGLSVKKEYLWYTTCPKCAKKYGKNPVVIMGQVG